MIRTIAASAVAVIVGFAMAGAAPRAAGQLRWDPDQNLSTEAGSGTWDSSTGNWNNGVATGLTWVNGNSATFGQNGAASTIDVAGGLTVGNLTLDTPNGSGNVSLQGLVTDQTLTIAPGSTWNLGGRTLNIKSDETANDLQLVMASGTLTLASSAAGGVLNLGPRYLTAGGWNLNGTISVTDGVRLTAAAGQLARVSVVRLQGGTVYNHAQNNGALSAYANSIAWEIPSGTVTFDRAQTNGNGSYELPGTVSGGGGVIVDTGGGGRNGSRIRLSGAVSYTGNTVVQSGWFQHFGSGTLSSTLTVKDGALATLKSKATYTGPIGSKVFVESGGTAGVLYDGTGDWTEGDITTFGANASFASGAMLGIFTEASTQTVSGSSLNGNYGLYTDGNLTIANSVATYTGRTRVGGGNLTLGIAQAIPATSVLEVGAPEAGAQLRLNGFNLTVAGLVGTGSGGGFRQIVNNEGIFGVAPAVLTANVAAGQSYRYTSTLGGNNASLGNADADNFSLVKNGPGSQEIGRSRYSGATTVNDGFLSFNGEGSRAQGAVTVNGTASIGGKGILGAVVTMNGSSRILPGNTLQAGTSTVGTLTFGNIAANSTTDTTDVDAASGLMLGAGTALEFELNGGDTTAGGTVNDQIAIVNGGSLILDGTLNVKSVGGTAAAGDFDADGTVAAADLAIWSTNFGVATGATIATGDANADGAVGASDFMIWQRNLGQQSANSFLSAVAGNRWTLISYNGTLTNNGLVLGAMPALSPGLSFSIQTDADSVDLVVQASSVAAVPEPGAAVLIGVGLAGWSLRRRQ